MPADLSACPEPRVSFGLIASPCFHIFILLNNDKDLEKIYILNRKKWFFTKMSTRGKAGLEKEKDMRE
jgi:hypothetical protein